MKNKSRNGAIIEQIEIWDQKLFKGRKELPTRHFTA